MNIQLDIWIDSQIEAQRDRYIGCSSVYKYPSLITIGLVPLNMINLDQNRRMGSQQLVLSIKPYSGFQTVLSSQSQAFLEGTGAGADKKKIYEAEARARFGEPIFRQPV